MKETVTFFEARVHPLLGSGVGITGISLRDTGSYAEGFLILPKAEDGYRHQVFHFESGSSLALPEIEALLTAHIRMWLQGELDAHLLRWQESHPTLPLVRPYTLHEIADPAHAKLVILSTLGLGILERIHKQTRTAQLKKYAESISDIAGYFTPLK